MRVLISVRGAGALALGLLALAGCMPGDFDKALEKAPVRAVGTPDGWKSGDIGKVVLPLSLPAGKTGIAARFLVSGTETPSLAVVDLDAAGRATVHTASDTELSDLTSSSKAPAISAVELEDKRILLGTPYHGQTNPMVDPRGRAFFLQLVDTAKDVEFKLSRGADPGADYSWYGLGVAAGRLTGGPAEDYVVAAEEGVLVTEDGNELKLLPTRDDCAAPIDATLTNKYRFRALAVGDLVESNAGEELAVGVPRDGSAPGKVRIMSVTMGMLGCQVTLDAPMGEARFGASLAIVDTDQDGKKDHLIVGAAGQRAYVYNLPLTTMPAPAPSLVIRPPGNEGGATGDFGYRVTALDTDGVAGLEWVVSAPDAVVGAKNGAGQVVIYKSDGSMLTTVQEGSPGEQASFGLSLTGVKFTPGGCGMDRSVLVVGSTEEVFTFFRLPNGPGDPRCLK